MAATLLVLLALLVGCRGLRTVLDDIGRGIGVAAGPMERRAQALIATGRITEEALISALPTAQQELIQWDQLAADLIRRVQFKAQGVMHEGTVRNILHGVACDAASNAFNDIPPNFEELLRKNTLVTILAPGQVAELIGYAEVVKDTYDRLGGGMQPQLALHAARATISCARAGR